LRLCALRALIASLVSGDGCAVESAPAPRSSSPTPPLPRRHEKPLAMDPPSSQVMSATDDFQDKTVDECCSCCYDCCSSILDFLCCSS
ncbi:unnamed protein product, partial [Urochloa humidicola]